MCRDRGGLAAHSSPAGDAEVQVATLDEALTHLRELITSEIEGQGGPVFDCYGLRVTPQDACEP